MRHRLGLKLLVGTLAFAGCKTRDPDAAGLIEATANSSRTLERHELRCKPELVQTAEEFLISIIWPEGGPDGLEQDLTVSVSRAGRDLVKDAIGHGLMTDEGDIFIMFSGNVFNAEKHGQDVQALLTLESEPEVSSLRLTCSITNLKAHPE